MDLIETHLSNLQTINSMTWDDYGDKRKECVVYRKGDKDRKEYFDAKTKIHLLNDIESRTDSNEALFVSLNKSHSRLTESGVELRLREMGKKLGVGKVYLHKFRRTKLRKQIRTFQKLQD